MEKFLIYLDAVTTLSQYVLISHYKWSLESRVNPPHPLLDYVNNRNYALITLTPHYIDAF